jgi:hypothetical protein
MKVYKYCNSIGLRTIYAFEAESYAAAGKVALFPNNNVFLFNHKTMVAIYDHWFTTSTAEARRLISTNLSKVLGRLDSAADPLLQVGMKREVPVVLEDHVVDSKEKLYFAVPFMLPFQKDSENLANSEAAKREGYTSDKDIEDLKFKRVITLSWEKNASYSDFAFWMKHIEGQPMCMEGKFYSTFCGACKNIFKKLSEGCTLDFLSSSTCKMGLDTTPDQKPMHNVGKGDYDLSTPKSEVTSLETV